MTQPVEHPKGERENGRFSMRGRIRRSALGSWRVFEITVHGIDAFPVLFRIDLRGKKPDSDELDDIFGRIARRVERLER